MAFQHGDVVYSSSELSEVLRVDAVFVVVTVWHHDTRPCLQSPTNVDTHIVVLPKYTIYR